MIGEQPAFAAIVVPETAQDAPPDDQAVAPEPFEMELDVKIDTVLNTSTLAITDERLKLTAEIDESGEHGKQSGVLRRTSFPTRYQEWVAPLLLDLWRYKRAATLMLDWRPRKPAGLNFR